MEKRIYKYELETINQQIISIPSGAEILTAQVQNEKLYLWALVNPDEKYKEERCIEVFGTGHPIPYEIGVGRKYLGTYQLCGGGFVGHVFERIG